MREIKFRAWDKKNKEMSQVVEMIFNQYGGIDVRTSRRMDINEDCLGKDSLMQYTGLKDKNGKMIFEGDIVKENRFSSLSQVIWSQGEGSLVGKVKGLFGEESDLTGFIHELGKFEFKGIKGITKAHYIGEFEVIGNIYENPELLTK